MAQLDALSPKDPNDVSDWPVNWASWLQDGEVIVDSEWIVPDGIEVETETFTNTTATIWLSGGVAGASYRLTNRITTNSTPIARVKDKTITIRVKDL